MVFLLYQSTWYGNPLLQQSRILNKPPGWKVAAAHRLIPRAGICDLWRKGFPTRVRDLTNWSFLCSKVLFKYNRDGESFWHRKQKAKESAPLLIFSKVFYGCEKAVNQIRQTSSRLSKFHQASLPQHEFLR